MNFYREFLEFHRAMQKKKNAEKTNCFALEGETKQNNAAYKMSNDRELQKFANKIFECEVKIKAKESD